MIIPRGPGLRGIFIFSHRQPIPLFHRHGAKCLLRRIFCLNLNMKCPLASAPRMCPRHSFAILVSACILVFNAQSCVDHKLPTPDGFGCSGVVVSYEHDVWPIIETNCAIVGDGGCHNGGNGASRDWRVFANVQSHAGQIKDRITRTPGTAGYMPKIGSLSDEQIRLISCWVDQGAQDN